MTGACFSGRRWPAAWPAIIAEADGEVVGFLLDACQALAPTPRLDLLAEPDAVPFYKRVTRPPPVWLQSSTATIDAHRFDAANDEASAGGRITFPLLQRLRVALGYAH